MYTTRVTAQPVMRVDADRCNDCSDPLTVPSQHRLTRSVIELNCSKVKRGSNRGFIKMLNGYENMDRHILSLEKESRLED